MPTQGVRVLHSLVRFQGRQVPLLTVRKAAFNLHLLIQSKAVGRAAEHQAEVGGRAAAEGVHHELVKVELILDLLTQVDSDLRAATSELSTLTVAVCDRGGCLAQVRRFSTA